MDTTQDLRLEARRLFDAAVTRADPWQAVRKCLNSPLPVLPDNGRYVVIAIGKAAIPMLRAALDVIPDPRDALAVTNSENLAEVPGARVLSGSHPVPDAASETAGRAVLGLLDRAGSRDRVIALISGGGSALAVAPVAGVTLADKAAMNALLLESGLEINDMNLIRQHLSDLKGGGMLRHAAPAEVTAYILSDVIGDDLRAIASGPTTSPISHRSAAQALMQESGLWAAAPTNIRNHLSKPEDRDIAACDATNILVGSNRQSLDAVAKAASNRFHTQIIDDHMTGDVRVAADRILHCAAQWDGPRPAALIFGGETTVKIQGTGKGGRNQELALRVALGAENKLSPGWVFLSGGTDGRDGPTTAAGGIVDAETIGKISAAGGDTTALLANNDSYAALSLANDLLVTGGTGTNVADVQVLLLS